MEQNMNYIVKKIQQDDIDTYTLLLENNGEEFEISVSTQSLIEIELLSPRIISKEEYETLQKISEESAAYHKSINYISYRKRSIYEVKVYLIQKNEYSSEVAKTTIEKLQSQGYLDDASFIGSFLNDAFITSTKGPKKISFELTQKYKCSSDLVEKLVHTKYTDEIQKQMVDKLMQKLLRKKYLSVLHAKNKIQQKLFESGYSESIIQHALTQVSSEKILVDERKIQNILEKTFKKKKKKEESIFVIHTTLQQKLIQSQISYDEAKELVDIYMLEHKIE